MIKIIEKNKVNFKFKSIVDSNIGHLFTSRNGLQTEEEVKDYFAANYLVKLKQVHGDKVHSVTESFLQEFEKLPELEGDGLVTSIKDVLLLTYHADCLPLYLIDYKKQVIGLAHSGWKGTYKNILSKVVSLMEEDYSSEKKDIKLYIGPGIDSCCYEVSQDLYEKFKKKYPQAEEAFSLRGGSYYISLSEIVSYQAGLLLKNSNIYNSRICTSCNLDNFYSYRKEDGKTGRMLAGIILK